MTRLQLRVYKNPGRAEIVTQFKRVNGEYETMTAVIDTGAEVSLFPETLLKIIEYRLTQRGKIKIDQAGIAQQSFDATEAIVTIQLEDMVGNRTQDIEIRAWFTDTDVALLGFEGLLDRANLQISMLAKLEGFLEIDA